MANPLKSPFFREHKAIIISIVFFFAVVSIWLGSMYLIPKYISDENNQGLFGDSFGAVNALFSGLAFAGLIVTILLQRDDLRTQQELLILQQEELKLSREELKKSVEAQTKSSNALDEQKQIMLSQSSFSLVFNMINNFNEFRDRNNIPEVMGVLTQHCTYGFSEIWKLLVEKQTSVHEINEAFVRHLGQNLPLLLDTHKHNHDLKSYVQFASNIMYNIKANRPHLGEGRVQAIFLCQLNVNERIMLHLSTLHRGDMPTCEGLFWGEPFTRELMNKVNEHSDTPCDFSDLDHYEIVKAVKKYRVGYNDDL